MNKLILIVLFLELTNSSRAQFTEQWTHEYNCSVNGQESAYKLIGESNGEIYTVGNRYNAVFLSKHDSNGNLVWRNSELPQDLYLRGFDRDTSGNFFIFGTRILKCDSIGNLIDSTDFSFIPNFSQLASVIAGQDAFYLAVSIKVGSDYRIQTLKMDYNFNIVWQMIYNSSNSDTPQSILLDSNENVFVTGNNTGNNIDILILKYDANGVFKFQKTYNNSAFNEIDYPRTSRIDLEENLVVSGETYESPGNYDGMRITLKYDNLGNLIWQELYDDPNCNISSIGHKLIIDSNYYYVASVTTCSGITLSKLSTSGDSLWTVTRNIGVDMIIDMLFDDKHDVILNAVGGINNDIVIICFDTTGNFVWQKEISGTLMNYQEDRPSDMIFNSFDSSIITCGYLRNLNTSNDAVIISFKDSVFKWSDVYNDFGDLGEEYFDIAINSMNEIIGVGQANYYYYPQNEDSIILVKLDLGGNVIWQEIIEKTFDNINDLFIDQNDDYYIFSQNEGIQKFSKNGNLLWQQNISMLSTYKYDGVNSIYYVGVVDSNGLYEMINGRIDTSGNNFNFNSFVTYSSDDLGCNKILINGNYLYFIGSILYDFDYQYKPFITKTDLNGNVIWEDTISKDFYSMIPWEAKLDLNGNVCLTGAYVNYDYECDSIYFFKVNGNGQVISRKYYTSPYNEFYNSKFIFDQYQDYYIVNYGNYNHDYLRIKLIDSNGTENWSVDYDLGQVYSMTFELYNDIHNNIIVTIGAQRIIIFNQNGFLVDDYLTSINNSSIGGEMLLNNNNFVISGFINNAAIKYVGYSPLNTLEMRKHNSESSLITFPNPTNSEFNLIFNEIKDGIINIYDINGKLVFKEFVNCSSLKLSPNLPNGIYQITFLSKFETLNSKFVITD